jgi:ribonuclease Z
MPRLAGYLVDGLSIGGIETCIDFPELKLCFDLGRCPDPAVQRPTVLFTHAHMDHMGGVAWHASTRELRQLSPPTYVVPRENAADFARLCEVWRALDRGDATGWWNRPRQFELPCKPRPFRSPHRVPTQGYVLWKRHRKLRPEYLGRTPDELRELAASLGPALYDWTETPEIAFTGDTLIEVLEREPTLLRARLLVIEVTFVDERVPIEKARSKGHIHLDEILERAALFENEAILFTHFSSRYRDSDVLRALERLPESLRSRVTPLLASSSA